MLEELFNLVRESSHDAVVNNPDVPNEHNNEVVAEATNTVASGLRNMVAGGGLKSIISLFQSKDDGNSLSDNPLVSMMVGHLSGKLSTKYNMDESKANSVAAGLIPNVLQSLVSKSNDPADNGFSLEKLLNSITGGKTEEVVQEEQKKGKSGFNFKDLINKVLGGGDDNKEGGGGLMDIITKLAGGALSQQKRNGGGGGLLNVIKGFFKK
jgi:hypothetical protein